uniref:Uncharacterized protein n=1 Tax=Nonomuraea gerenzanensis TaxID=93944 RepID=A0A1M4E652_9ACTN|nr:hypothetical protein BN4615_P3770 [Nonomuraea gerenzanensis]
MQGAEYSMSKSCRLVFALHRGRRRNRGDDVGMAISYPTASDVLTK